jgi:hypothetical protein
MQQEIAEASDDAARKYYEETPEKDRTTLGVTAVMRAAVIQGSVLKVHSSCKPQVW